MGEGIDGMRHAVCVTHDATVETNGRVHDVGGHRFISSVSASVSADVSSLLLFAPLFRSRFPFSGVLLDYGSDALGRRRKKEHSREDEDVDARHAAEVWIEYLTFGVLYGCT